MAWKNPFARQPTPDILFPYTVDLGHGVRVTVRLADCPTSSRAIPCWVYVTDGLAALGQKEIVFALAREDNEHPSRVPEEPFRYLSDIIRYAQGGTVVDAGEVTWYDSQHALLGGHILYIHAQAIPNVELPPEALTALLIRQDELAVAQQFGATRVMTRLAFATRHYPCPPWSDRRRIRARASAPPEDTMLRKVAVAQTQTVTTLFDQRSLRISTTPAQRETLQTVFEERPPNVPLALLSAIDARADGCLVWQPGMKGLNAVTPNGSTGSHISGAFVILAIGADKDQFVIIEDGFALTVTGDTGERLTRALTTGERLEVATANGVRVVVNTPERAPGPTAGASVVLLHPDDLLDARGATTWELSEFIGSCFRTLDGALLAGTMPAMFDVVLVVKPHGTAKAWVTADARPADLAALQTELEQLLAPTVHGGPIAFALRGGSPVHPANTSRPLLPAEWQEAATAAAAALGKDHLTIDEIIEYVWPDKT